MRLQTSHSGLQQEDTDRVESYTLSVEKFWTPDSLMQLLYNQLHEIMCRNVLRTLLVQSLVGWIWQNECQVRCMWPSLQKFVELQEIASIFKTKLGVVFKLSAALNHKRVNKSSWLIFEALINSRQ